MKGAEPPSRIGRCCAASTAPQRSGTTWREIQKIVNRPEIKKELGERGMEAFSGPTEEFEQFLKDQLVVWEKLIADAGIEKQ